MASDEQNLARSMISLIRERLKGKVEQLQHHASGALIAITMTRTQPVALSEIEQLVQEMEIRDVPVIRVRLVYFPSDPKLDIVISSVCQAGHMNSSRGYTSSSCSSSSSSSSSSDDKESFPGTRNKLSAKRCRKDRRSDDKHCQCHICKEHRQTHLVRERCSLGMFPADKRERIYNLMKECDKMQDDDTPCGAVSQCYEAEQVVQLHGFEFLTLQQIRRLYNTFSDIIASVVFHLHPSHNASLHLSVPSTN